MQVSPSFATHSSEASPQNLVLFSGPTRVSEHIPSAAHELSNTHQAVSAPPRDPTRAELMRNMSSPCSETAHSQLQFTALFQQLRELFIYFFKK